MHPIKSYLASQFENELDRALHLAADRNKLLLFSFQRIFCATSLDQTSPVASMYFDQETDLHQDEAENGHYQHSNQLFAPEYFAQYLRSKQQYKIDFISGLDLSNEEHLQYLIRLLWRLKIMLF